MLCLSFTPAHLQLFSRFGDIHELAIKRQNSCAFVTFNDRLSAIRAQSATDGLQLGLSRLVVVFKRVNPLLH